MTNSQYCLWLIRCPSLNIQQTTSLRSEFLWGARVARRASTSSRMGSIAGIRTSFSGTGRTSCRSRPMSFAAIGMNQVKSQAGLFMGSSGGDSPVAAKNVGVPSRDADTSGAKAQICGCACGTDESVPFQNEASRAHRASSQGLRPRS